MHSPVTCLQCPHTQPWAQGPQEVGTPLGIIQWIQDALNDGCGAAKAGACQNARVACACLKCAKKTRETTKEGGGMQACCKNSSNSGEAASAHTVLLRVKQHVYMRAQHQQTGCLRLCLS